MSLWGALWVALWVALLVALWVSMLRLAVVERAAFTDRRLRLIIEGRQQRNLRYLGWACYLTPCPPALSHPPRSPALCCSASVAVRLGLRPSALRVARRSAVRP